VPYPTHTCTLSQLPSHGHGPADHNQSDSVARAFSLSRPLSTWRNSKDLRGKLDPWITHTRLGLSGRTHTGQASGLRRPAVYESSPPYRERPLCPSLLNGLYKYPTCKKCLQSQTTNAITKQQTRFHFRANNY